MATTQTPAAEALQGEQPDRVTSVILPPRPSVVEMVVEAWRCRRVVVGLGHSVLKIRYRETILGWLWLPIQVTVTTVALTVIFGNIFDSQPVEGVPYFLFATLGLTTWRLFDRSLVSTVRSFGRFGRVLRELRVPSVLVPIAATAECLLELLVYLVLVAGAGIYFSVADDTVYFNLGPGLLLLPVALAWAVLLASGIGFVTGPIFMRTRDIRFALRLVIPFFLFVTPILYPLSDLHGWVHTLALVNPLTSIVELARLGAFGSADLQLTGLVVSLAITVAAVAGGLAFLSRFGPSLIGGQSIAAERADEAPDPL
jgi:lipopolysaccharide transport system permease protein